MSVYREFVSLAAANLWRMKLRTTLTATGIVIGIAALVAMLSFAFGIQKNVAERFRSLGLFHMLQVMPPYAGLDEDADPDASSPTGDEAPSRQRRSLSRGDTRPGLNDAELARIAAVPGVEAVYPHDTFDAQLELGERRIAITAQALPADFVRSRALGALIAGRFFDDNAAGEIVLSRRTARRLADDADSLIGVALSVRIAGRAAFARQLFEHAMHSLALPAQAETSLRAMASAWLAEPHAEALTLTVCGVSDFENAWGFELRDALIPSGRVAGIDRLSVTDPFSLLAEITSGTHAGYPLATVVLSERVDHAAVRDSVESLGLRTLSFGEEFERMKRHFLVFDLMVGVIGFIALLIASLGITNTMVMSITERRREIGILKALGAEDGHVRGLFLVESALIGLLGSLVGLIFGWLISRAGSFITRQIMVAQQVPEIDIFHLPLAAAIASVAFGVALSLLAGLHPASRAAATDPVRALRDL